MTAPTPPSSPLRREVEPPRTRTGPLMPLMSLGATTMLTLAMALAVATPHGEPIRDEQVESATRAQPARAWNTRAYVDGLGSCMRDWAERTHKTAGDVTIGIQVTASGAIDDLAVSGLDDRIVPTCLATVTRQFSMPSRGHEAHYRVDVTYVGGQTRVTATPLE